MNQIEKTTSNSNNAAHQKEKSISSWRKKSDPKGGEIWGESEIHVSKSEGEYGEGKRSR